MKVAGAVFLVLGLALLAGGAAWYHHDVERPLAWPRAHATVASSGVVNPRNPGEHSPELVLRIETAGAPRQVTVRPGWSSGSYDMVKSHVERFPAGSAVEVALNPADANDVRYELGA